MNANYGDPILQKDGKMGTHERTVEQKPLPWGFWATVGFSCIIAVVYIFVQTIVVTVFAAAGILRTPDFDINEFANSLQTNGLFLAIAICAAAPSTIGLAALFAKIRKPITIKEYLCLHRPGWKELSKWSLVALLFAGCSDALTFLVRRPIIPEFMVSTYTTAYFTPLLWLAFIVVAPLSEEIFFRGFVFKGIEHSRIGPAGAVIITSLAWSAMHVQYDTYGIAVLFAGGLLLGYARLKSNSIYPPIIMHILQNIIATVEVAIYLKEVSNAA